MQSNDLMMLVDDDIDYTTLSEDTLKYLALAEDLFIANSALAELNIRNSNLAADISLEILVNLRRDCYLKATALEILFNNNRQKAIGLILSQIDAWDGYMLNSIMDIIGENEPEFKSEPGLAIVGKVIERLKSFDESANFPPPEVRDNFLKVFARLSSKLAIN